MFKQVLLNHLNPGANFFCSIFLKNNREAYKLPMQGIRVAAEWLCKEVNVKPGPAKSLKIMQFKYTQAPKDQTKGKGQLRAEINQQ